MERAVRGPRRCVRDITSNLITISIKTGSVGRHRYASSRRSRMAESEPAKDQRIRSGDHLCSDIRDTCVVGDALRRGLHPIDALSRALDELLYSGVTPWRKPLERGDAVARLAER